MKNTSLNIAAIVALFLLASCSSKDIVIDDFESGTYSKWNTEGTAFGETPASGAHSGQQEVTGYKGKYLANSFYGNDDARGILVSEPFEIKRDYINFLLGGGKGVDTYIELVIDSIPVYTMRPMVESEVLRAMSWDVKAYKGKEAQIRIVDNQRGGWGHILVDDIVMSNTYTSDYLINHQLSFLADKKYLLLPIDDNSPETAIQLLVDDQAIGMPMNVRLATNDIEYWVPMEIEKYAGKTVNLSLAQVAKSDIGYTKICQSDTFSFEYNEKYRPSYHFTPNYGWMNDPNGMVYKDGEYHLYYQYNPYGSMWGNMHWGHAVSKDMVSWKQELVAIAPDSLGTIFSGSAVVDKHNTAGFGANAIVAIYTSAGATQKQSIAYSTDNGRTFKKYSHNPVLVDPSIVDFRDPKVFWHTESKQWVMSLATSQTITFYGSKDLKAWHKLSEFGEGIGDHGGVWECPDLFALKYQNKTKWVLLVSINPGGPNGGSATQYFIGDFDGYEFTADPSVPSPIWIDYGKDNYAGVSWSNIPSTDGRRLFIGWMNNWDYARDVPILNFRSATTVPRELVLRNNGKHLVLASEPVKELEKLRGEPVEHEAMNIAGTGEIADLITNNNGAYELEMEVDAATNFTVALKNSQNEKLSFNFDVVNSQLKVDRANSGIVDFGNKFASQAISSPLPQTKKYHIRIFVDQASSEIFINNGELVQTNLIFPSEPYNALEFESEGRLSVSAIKAYPIK